MKFKKILAILLVMGFLIPYSATALSMPKNQELILIDKSLSSEDADAVKKLLGAEDSSALTLSLDLQGMLGSEKSIRAAAYYIPGDGELVVEKRTPDELRGIDSRFVAEEVRRIGLTTGTLRIASLDAVQVETLQNLNGNIGQNILQNIDKEDIARQIKKQIPKQAGNLLDRFIHYIEDEWFIITRGNDDGTWMAEAKKSLESVGLREDKPEREERENADDPVLKSEADTKEQSESEETETTKNETTQRVKSALESVKMAVKSVADIIWSLFQ